MELHDEIMALPWKHIFHVSATENMRVYIEQIIG